MNNTLRKLIFHTYPFALLWFALERLFHIKIRSWYIEKPVLTVIQACSDEDVKRIMIDAINEEAREKI